MATSEHPTGQRILLPGHFPEPVVVESARIRLAYAHDKQFAVSLSGIRTLPHQIEAVYIRMLPQPRLRYLLADDPGAGKTIMAGLLIKELKLRQAVERILILCPAPLTIQWQDELLRWFGEPFDIIFSAVDQQQLVNPWQRLNQVVASLDYAKQDDVRERVRQQHWDMVVIDEAHKCSAYTKRSASRGDEPDKTKRYQLAERLTSQADHGYVYFGSGCSFGWDNSTVAPLTAYFGGERFARLAEKPNPPDHRGIHVLADRSVAMIRGRVQTHPRGESARRLYKHGGLSLMEMLVPWLVLEQD